MFYKKSENYQDTHHCDLTNKAWALKRSKVSGYTANAVALTKNQTIRLDLLKVTETKQGGKYYDAIISLLTSPFATNRKSSLSRL